MTEDKKEKKGQKEKPKETKKPKGKKKRAAKKLSLFLRFVKFVVKNTIRALFLLVMVGLLLSAAAWFTAIKYFNAEKAGTLLTGVLQRAFNKPVVMESIKLVSLNTVEIKNLKIIDNNLGFYNEFISVGSVVIRYNLMSVLENRIEIDEVLLRSPQVSIVKDENGVLNSSGLKISSKESSQGQEFEFIGPEGTPYQIVIEDWTIEGGTFSYRDLASKISHSLNGVNIHFFNLKFNAPTGFDLNFVLRNNLQGKIIETEVVSKGTVNLANFSPADMALTNTRFNLMGFRKPVTLKADVKNFLNPAISVSSSLPAFNYDDISLFLAEQVNFKAPALNLKAKMQFEDNFKHLKISSLNLKNKDIDTDITANVSLSPALNVDADFKTKEFEAEKVDYLNLWKRYDLRGKLSARGKFIVKDGKWSFPKVEAEINGMSSNIQNFIITNVQGKYTAENNFDIMNADIKEGFFKVGRQVVTNIRGRAGYEHKKQNFYALLNHSYFNGQNIRMSVAISKVRSPKNRVIKALLSVDTFNPQEVFDTVQDFVDALQEDGPSNTAKDTSDLAWLRDFRSSLPTFMPNINGSLYARRFESPIASGNNFTAEFNIKDMVPGMKNLSGTIDAKLESGIIHKLQETADRYKALGIAFQPFVLMNNMERAGSFKMGKVLKDTPFEIMNVSADFNNGKMDINNFYVDGKVVAATVDGKVDWVGESLDVDIFTMFKNTSKRGALSENLTDESGEPALAFRASGHMDKTSIQIRSPKKTGSKIKAAREKGLRTDFKAIDKFAKER